MRVDLPRCERCDRQVDAVERRPLPSGAIVFVARCHGDEEIVPVTPEEALTMTDVRFTTAFRRGEEEEG